MTNVEFLDKEEHVVEFEDRRFVGRPRADQMSPAQIFPGFGQNFLARFWSHK